MMKIWLLLLTGVIVLYECMKYITEMIVTGRVRFSMLLLFFTSLYPHYYSLWVYINYINDHFYEQWDHQLYFTITEIISTSIVLNLINRNKQLRPFKLLLIMAISVVHICVSGVDNFFVNVILAKGSLHRVSIFIYNLNLICCYQKLSGTARFRFSDFGFVSVWGGIFISG